MVEDVERESTHLGDGARTVRAVLGVTDVDDRLVRQLVEDRTRDGQTPHPAVEDPDGRVHASQSIRNAPSTDHVTRVTVRQPTPTLTATSRAGRSGRARPRAPAAGQ